MQQDAIKLDNNLNETVSYYDFFSAFGYSDRDTVFIRSFKDKGEKDGGRNESFQLKNLSFFLKTLHEENQKDRGIFFVVNGGGQSDNAVKIARAQFIDFDDYPFDEQIKRLSAFPLEPSIIIKTRKSLHAYWLLDNGEIKYFREIQQRLIQYFGSDSTIKNESRVMRLYGFEHRKTDTPVMVTLIKFNPELRYTQRQFHENLPLLENVSHSEKIKIDKNAEIIPVGKRHHYVVKRIGEFIDKIGKNVDNESILALVEHDFMLKCENASQVNMDEFRQKYLKTIATFRERNEAEQKDPGFYSFALKAWKDENPGKEFNTDTVSWDEVREAGRRAKEKSSSDHDKDWNEYIAKVFPESDLIDPETGEIIHKEAADDSEEENKLPEWLIIRQWQGRDITRIDEPLFAEIFKKQYKVNRINGVFYLDGKEASDDEILMMVQSWIAKYFKENTGRSTNNVYITLCNSAFTKQPEPDETKIYCKNNITITVKKDGTFDFKEEDIFTLSRIGATYNKEADCPTFKKYLSDLFYDDDLPAIQEYFGYCLIPCTRAQAGLFVKGKGGEGKSTLRDVSMALYGNAAIQEYVHQLGERFTIANLENKLVMVDDDLRSDLLNDTSTIKKLITAREKFQVERKHKTKYDAYLFARIIAIGNTFIGSKFDHSDGFYRRQLLVDVKPKTRDEKDDDRFMSDKCIAEIEGVLNWALEGLSRLIQNNYHFTVSDRMQRTLDDIKHDGDNTLGFIEDSMFIHFTGDWSNFISSADLFVLYVLWCEDNGETPIKRKSFLIRMSERFKEYKGKCEVGKGRVNGYFGMMISHIGQSRLDRLNSNYDFDRIKRLP